SPLIPPRGPVFPVGAAGPVPPSNGTQPIGRGRIHVTEVSLRDTARSGKDNECETGSLADDSTGSVCPRRVQSAPSHAPPADREPVSRRPEPRYRGARDDERSMQWGLVPPVRQDTSPRRGG